MTDAWDGSRVLIGDDVSAFHGRDISLNRPAIEDLGVIGIEEHPAMTDAAEILFAFHFDAEKDFPHYPKDGFCDRPIKKKSKSNRKRIPDEITIILGERFGFDVRASEIIFQRIMVYESFFRSHRGYSTQIENISL